MSTQSKLFAAATAGLSAGSLLVASVTALAADDKKGEVECFAVNSCKGMGSCAVTKAHLTVANEVFKNKFSKSVAHECGGSNTCAAKNGMLEFIKKPSAGECFKAGGFVFEKQKDGKSSKEKLVIRDASGVKTSG